MPASDFWLLDIRISGTWRPRPDPARTLDDARGRADAVYRWATMRVRSAVTGECWVREAGRGWVKADDVPPPQPIAPSSTTSADPRRPLRHPAHATQPVPGPDGIPDEQLQWWQKN